jgi:hypothetical protein
MLFLFDDIYVLVAFLCPSISVRSFSEKKNYACLQIYNICWQKIFFYLHVYLSM